MLVLESFDADVGNSLDWPSGVAHYLNRADKRREPGSSPFEWGRECRLGQKGSATLVTCASGSTERSHDASTLVMLRQMHLQPRTWQPTSQLRHDGCRRPHAEKRPSHLWGATPSRHSGGHIAATPKSASSNLGRYNHLKSINPTGAGSHVAEMQSMATSLLFPCPERQCCYLAEMAKFRKTTWKRTTAAHP